jgi:hypothetical protein
MQPSWRRPVLTDSEWNAKLVLEEVFQHGDYAVFPGFKLSTIIYEPPKGFSRQSPEWNYATRAHFDFVVYHTETHLPEFAIELDDPTHWRNPEVQRRDRMKNALCEAAGFELLRIESSALDASSRTGNRRLIKYLIDAWELGKAFTEQQEKGYIPADEIYDYRNTLALNPESGSVEFVHDFARPAVDLAFKLHDEGTIKGYFIERLNFYWRNGWAEGWTWLQYNDELYFFEAYRVRSYQFYCGVPAGELAEDLAVAAIGEKLKRIRPRCCCIVGRHWSANSKACKHGVTSLRMRFCLTICSSTKVLRASL